MANDLVVVDVEKYPALVPGSDLQEAIEANAAAEGGITEADLTRIPTPSAGGLTWTWDGASGSEESKTIDGVLVGYCARGTLWPSEEPTAAMPLLVSYDMRSAVKVGDDYGDIDPDELEKYRNVDGTYDWLRLPWNEFGSGKSGFGKRCKESRMLFILRAGDPFPVLVRAQPGSLKTIRPFIKKLTVPHWRAEVSLALRAEMSKGGQKYSQIVPTLVGTLDKEAGALVKKMYTDPIMAIVKNMSFDHDREEVGGEV